MARRTPEERFWSKVQKSDGCWLWMGARAKGYGKFAVSGSRDVHLAHRISYQMAYGPFSPEKVVCHKCDNPPCVRPDHLFLGTMFDNVQDMLAKNRESAPPIRRGHAVNTSKLTEQQVRAIMASPLSGARLADILGVNRCSVNRIRAGKTWRHLRL